MPEAVAERYMWVAIENHVMSEDGEDKRIVGVFTSPALAWAELIKRGPQVAQAPGGGYLERTVEEYEVNVPK